MTASPPDFDCDSIRRTLLSLIRAEQSDAHCSVGRLPDSFVYATLADEKSEYVDQIRIDEDGFGFDSISRLNLVGRVSRFYGLHLTGIDDYLVVRPTIGEWVELIRQHCRMVGDTMSIVFETSGSTGSPKQIKQPMPGLLQEVDALRHVLCDVATNTRIVTVVPPHHIFGFLFGILLPRVTGLPVLDLYQTSPFSLVNKLCQGDLVIATPSIWAQIASADQRFPDEVCGVTSGAPSKRPTWDALKRQSLSQLTEVYGATETGGIAFRRSFQQDYELLPHLLRSGDDIFVKGTSAALPIQDNLRWVSQNRFVLLGRKDDVVQISGKNVSLGFVENELRKINGVKTATVRLNGERLATSVTPSLPFDEVSLLDQITKHVRENLPPEARVTVIDFLLADGP